MAYGKEEWWIQHRNHSGTILNEFKPANDIHLEVNRNTPSSCTYELARSDTKLTRDCFAPYRTDCFLYRGNDLIMSGPHTSRKWSSDNEGTIQVAMQDWMHLLEKLYVPVTVTGDNIAFQQRKDAYKQWPELTQTSPPQIVNEADRNGVALNIIVRELLALRNAVDALQWNVEVMPTGGDIGTKTNWTAHWLDGKTMLDHIKGIGGMHLGFDFDCKWTSNNHVDVRLWHNTDAASYGGKKATPVWVFTDGSQFTSFSWEDTGPKATRTFGMGQGNGPVGTLGDVSVYAPSDATYRQLESVEDVGELSDMYQYSAANDDYRSVKRITGAMGHRNRGPIHQLNVTFNTSIFPFNFWTTMLPGVTVYVKYDFGFHAVDSNYILLGYSADINPQGDETITPDLERVLPYTG
jgi:hypothetical protein